MLVVNELKEKALQRYNASKGSDPEQLVSGSDDFTLFLWHPEGNKKPVARMTGERIVGGGREGGYIVRRKMWMVFLLF